MMDSIAPAHDYEALLKLERERNKRLIDNGEAQRDELAQVREERDMLARRAAEIAHELIALKYPKQQAA